MTVLPTKLTGVFIATQAVLALCITINKLKPDITAKTRVELRPLNIPCFLNDIVRISAPMVNELSLYYLYKPNGDVMKLDLQAPKLSKHPKERDVASLVAKTINGVKPIITQSNNYDVYSVKKNVPIDLFDKKVQEMDENDFMIGPVSVEDGGNWLLIVYTKDFNNNWIELFQVITLTIIEYVPITPSKPILHLGETFNLSFIYPIPNLVSCELVAPRSTFDRLFDRSRGDLRNCGFSVPNITEYDAGMWKIVAVGKIVYEGEVMLNINTSNDTSVIKTNLL